MPKLLITLPGIGDVVHELIGDNIVVGRTSDNSIQIDEPSISLHHARLTLQPRGYRLKDLGSTNQTWINGFAVTEVELTSRCMIRFGEVECVFLPEAKGPMWTDAVETRKELTEARAEIDLRKSEGDALRKEVELFSTEFARLKNESALAAQEREKLRAQNAALAEDLDRARQQNEAFTQRQKSAQRELEDFRTQLAAMTAERDAALTENQNVRPLFEEQKKENRAIAEQRDAAQKESASLATVHATLVTQFKKLHAENESALENLRGKTRELETSQAQAHSLGQELHALKSVHEQGQRQFAELRAALENLERELEATRAKQRQTQSDFSEAVEKNNVLQSALHDRETEAKAAGFAHEQLQAANQKLTEENATARHDIEFLTSRWNKLVAELQRVREALAHADRLVGAEPEVAHGQPHPAAVEAEGKRESEQNGHSQRAEDLSAPKHRASNGERHEPQSGFSEDQLFGTALQAMQAANERLRNNPHDRSALHEFFGNARSLAQHADATGTYTAVRCMASTLEALLGDFCKVPEQLDASRVRTLNRAVDTLRLLLDRDQFSSARDSFRAKICVISDDAEEPMIAASRLVDLDLSTVNYPTARFDALADQDCELVVLDPGSREPGWLEYCSRVRAFPRHKRTAIIVVTSESPDRAFPSSFGGNEDFICKPFNTFEMAVKMLTGIFKRRIERATALH